MFTLLIFLTIPVAQIQRHTFLFMHSPFTLWSGSLLFPRNTIWILVSTDSDIMIMETMPSQKHVYTCIMWLSMRKPAIWRWTLIWANMSQNNSPMWFRLRWKNLFPLPKSLLYSFLNAVLTEIWLEPCSDIATCNRPLIVSVQYGCFCYGKSDNNNWTVVFF